MYQLKLPSSLLQESNFVEILRQQALYHPNKIAYIFLKDGETEEVSLTYGELDRKARAIGQVLHNLGLAGERVLLMYSPGLEFISAFFGCLYAGAIAVPAYPPRRNQSMDRLQAIIQDCQAKHVLTTTAIWKSLENSVVQYPELSSLRWLASDNLASNFNQHWTPPEISGETIAFLQYTSGSTGTPKGVMVTHGNLLHNEQTIQTAFGHTQKTIVVGWLPLFHDMGLIGNVLQPLYLGIPCVLMSPVDFLQKPVRWLQAISRYGGTTSGGPNFAYDLCVRKVTPEQMAQLDLSSWEVAFNGAEPIRAETLQQFAEKFAPCGFRREAFYPCYGMAEATLFISGGEKSKFPVMRRVDEAALTQNQVVVASADSSGTRSLVSCGRSFLGQKVAIVDPDSLSRCPEGEVGEIWVSGESVAKGYWNQPERTEETFQAYLRDTGTGPFLRTGDLGFMQHGELFVTGRLKDAIIIRGRNHYPQDIELTVERSHLSLRPSCGAAFSVEVAGEEKLVVVQEVERIYWRKLDVQQVIGDIRQALTAQHGLQVHDIVLIKTGTVPKTSSGKIRRSACREQFLAGTLEKLEPVRTNSTVKSPGFQTCSAQLVAR